MPADKDYPVLRRPFTFGGRKLTERLESFSGRGQRRAAIHEYLKVAGARVEDMERSARRFEAHLEFLGDDCAKQFEDFVKFIDENPYGLLVHPSAGKFQAFCEGPSEEVNLQRSINEIVVRCSWVESNVGAPAPEPDVPGVPAAAQKATTQLSAFDQGVAVYMGAVGEAQARMAGALAAIQTAVAGVSSAADPIKDVRAAISTTVGATSAAVRAVSSVQVQAELLEQDAAAFISSATDFFDGESEQAGATDELDTLLGTVVARSAATQAAMLAASPTPAGAADAVAATEELVAACYVLSEAVKQSRPPVVLYTVPVTTDVVSLCVRLFPDADAAVQASIVLGLNRIPNPAAVRAGTVIRVPSRA